MTPNRRQLLLVIVLAILAYCALVFFGESTQVLDALRSLDGSVLAYGLLWASVNYAIRFLRWQLYLRELRIIVPLSASAIVFLSGFAMSVTPGKVGELIKAAMLKERFDVPIARSGPIVIAERVTDLAGLAVLIGWGGMMFPGGTMITVAAGLVVLSILSVCLVPPLGNQLLRMLALLPPLRSRRDRLHEAYSALRTTSEPRVLFPAIVLSILAWATHGVVLLLLTTRYSQLQIDLPGSMFAYSAPLLAGTLALIPGGLGITELSMAGILTAWSQGEGAPAAAASVTIALRGLTFWWAILIGVGSLVVWRHWRPRHSCDLMPRGPGYFGAALAIGACLRFVWFLLIDSVPVSDADIYYQGASGIASGRGFTFANGDPNGFWPSGYSYYLAAYSWLIGENYTQVFWPNLVLSLATISLTGVLAHYLVGARGGRAAAWICACYPSLVLLPTVALSENLYLPILILFAILTWHAASSNARWMHSVGAGLALGVAILVRPTAMALPLLPLVGTLARSRRFLGSIARTALIAMLGFVICIPWGLRQQRVFGEFTLSAFNGGPVLWMGNHDGEPTTSIPERFAHHDTVQRHHAMHEEAMQFIRQHPGIFLRRCLERSITALRSETFVVGWNAPGIIDRFGQEAIRILKGVTSLGWYALLIGSVVAVIVRWQRRGFTAADAVIATALAACALPFVVFDSQNRYHMPLVPFLIVLAAGSWRTTSTGERSVAIVQPR